MILLHSVVQPKPALPQLKFVHFIWNAKKNPHIKNENVNFSPDFEQPFVNEWHDISIIFKMFHKLIYM